MLDVLESTSLLQKYWSVEHRVATLELGSIGQLCVVISW